MPLSELRGSELRRRTGKIDSLIGARLLALRKERKLSQTAVGEQLGVTFQQIQKYERGINRISAASLHELSQALSVPMEYFFENPDSVRPKEAGSKVRAAQREPTAQKRG